VTGQSGSLQVCYLVWNSHQSRPLWIQQAEKLQRNAILPLISATSSPIHFQGRLPLYVPMDHDTSRNLDELRASRPLPIVSELIQIQKCQEQTPRDFSPFRILLCLSVSGANRSQNSNHTLSYTRFSEYDCNFAAVSYTCRPSAFEVPESVKYRVKLKSGQTRPAKVRDVVLDRVIKYILSQNISIFWIDQECIDQRDKNAKNAAKQCMDVVYRRSRYPVGILSTPLCCQEDIDNLYELLKGNFVGESPGVKSLELSISPWKAQKVIDMLFRLTCDTWWTRRWVFQEEYCAMERMRLLIPHKRGLNKAKDIKVLGNITDELAVAASSFRMEATRFCIASRDHRIFASIKSRRRRNLVLQRVKSYMMLRKYGWAIGDVGRDLAMSTHILADLCRRSALIPSDTLAIMANCCGYATRLQVKQLEAAGWRSLSLALLALFILNGEILRNDRGAHGDTVLDFIKRRSFQGFDPPGDTRHLTFIKRCRLPNVVLCKDGIMTEGYVWERCQLFKPRSDTWRCDESADWRAVLQQIAHQLPRKQRYLRTSIEKYLHGVSPRAMRPAGLQNIFQEMIENIAKAAKDGKSFVLARLQGYNQASAMFVRNRRSTTQMSIFTACEPADDAWAGPRSRFLDKYVSLRVDLDRQNDNGVPHLRTKGWVNGIWFPGSSNAQEVVFPWPEWIRATDSR